MVNFPTWICDCDSHSHAFLSLKLAFVLQWFSLYWKILVMQLPQFPLTFYQTKNGMPCFLTQLMTILLLILAVFVIIWVMFNGRLYLNSVLLLQLLSFASDFRLELMYISLTVNIRSILIHLHSFKFPQKSFFDFYQQNTFSESKVKFRQVNNSCKRVIEAGKFGYANKTNESASSQKLASQDFWEIADCSQD